MKVYFLVEEQDTLDRGDLAFYTLPEGIFSPSVKNANGEDSLVYKIEGNYAICSNPEAYHFYFEDNAIYLTDPETKTRGPVFFRYFEENDEFYWGDNNDEPEVFLYIEDDVVWDEEGEPYYVLDENIDMFSLLIILAHINEEE